MVLGNGKKTLDNALKVIKKAIATEEKSCQMNPNSSYLERIEKINKDMDKNERN